MLDREGRAYRYREGQRLEVFSDESSLRWVVLSEDETDSVDHGLQPISFDDLPVVVRDYEVGARVQPPEGAFSVDDVRELIVGLQSLTVRWRRDAERCRQSTTDAERAASSGATLSESFVRSCRQRAVDYDRRADEVELLLRLHGWED